MENTSVHDWPFIEASPHTPTLTNPKWWLQVGEKQYLSHYGSNLDQAQAQFDWFPRVIPGWCRNSRFLSPSLILARMPPSIHPPSHILLWSKENNSISHPSLGETKRQIPSTHILPPHLETRQFARSLWFHCSKNLHLIPPLFRRVEQLALTNEGHFSPLNIIPYLILTGMMKPNGKPADQEDLQKQGNERFSWWQSQSNANNNGLGSSNNNNNNDNSCCLESFEADPKASYKLLHRYITKITSE